jgi:phosphoribosylamine--glycine ligase
VKVLIVGQGGREHALAWKIAQSPAVERLFTAPGNPGIAQVATCEPIAATDVAGLAEFADREGIDLTVVGPEAPLVAGLVDEFEERGLAVFGPTREGARLEGSKSWAKDLCGRHGIPAGRSEAFTEPEPALTFLDELGPPYVVKADGLAAGKGVTVTEDRVEAERAVTACLARRPGEAAKTVVVEQFLEGREVSALALTDGRTVVPLALAQDSKRVGDGDTGPNTGGMGAYSPVPFVDEATRERIVADVLEGTVAALAAEGIRYRGVIYAGLMLTAEGPLVLEFNCRFGDPETQAIIPRLRSDLGEVLLACAEGHLASSRVTWSEESCVTVVMASEGYPGEPRTGVAIDGLAEAEAIPGVQVFHSGTALRDGRVLSAGGRVLAVSALGPSLEDARGLAYEACGLVSFDGMHYRRDIAAVEEPASASAEDRTGG